MSESRRLRRELTNLSFGGHARRRHDGRFPGCRHHVERTVAVPRTRCNVMIRVWNLGTAVLITWPGSVFGCGTFLPYGIAATNISSGRMSNPTGQLIQASFQSA